MKKKDIILITAILLHSLFTNHIHSQSIKELSFFAPLPSIFEAKYLNNHLFISQQGLRVMNVSNPFNPQLISQTTYPGNFAYQIAVQGNRAYLAKGGSGYFAVYNITNFNSPSLDGTLIIPATAFLLFGDMVPFGNYVYMTGHDTLYIINVSNVSSPQLAGKIHVQQEAGEIEINDNFLYLVTNSSLRIYDISSPAIPVFVNSVPHRHAVHQGIEIDTAGNRLFSPWRSTLQEYHGHDAYNISNPLSPVFLFSDSTTFGSGEFGLTGYYKNILFLSQSGRIKAFDVSSTGHRYLTSFLGQNVANSSVSIEVKDSIFYNVRRSGVEILRYSGPFPTNIGNNNVNIKGNTLEVYMNTSQSGNKQFVLSTNHSIENAELKIFNVLGQSIYKEQNIFLLEGQSKLITLANFSSGIYFISLNGNRQVFTRKIFLR